MSDVSLAPAWQAKKQQQQQQQQDGGGGGGLGSNPPGIATANFTKTSHGVGGGSTSLSARLSKWATGGMPIQSALIGDTPPSAGPSKEKDSWRQADGGSSSLSSASRFGDGMGSSSWGGSGFSGFKGPGSAGDRLGMDFSGKAKERWGGKEHGDGVGSGSLPSIYNHDLGPQGRPSSFVARPASGLDSGGSFSGLNGAGRSRGFAAGRGRGLGAPTPSSPGSGLARPDPHSSLSSALASDQRYGYKYTQAELKRMYDAMLRGGPGHFGTLPVPPGAQLPDYTGVLGPEEPGAAASSHDTSHGFQVAAGPPPPPRPSAAFPAAADRAERWTAKGEGSSSIRQHNDSTLHEWASKLAASKASGEAVDPLMELVVHINQKKKKEDEEEEARRQKEMEASPLAELIRHIRSKAEEDERKEQEQMRASPVYHLLEHIKELAQEKDKKGPRDMPAKPPGPEPAAPAASAAMPPPAVSAAPGAPTAATAAAASSAAPGFQWTPAAVFAADQWVYRDPQGVVQGPFTKVDILDWFDGGFLPQDLPIKSHMPPDAPYVPLSTMLQLWASFESKQPPPGFVPPMAPPQLPVSQPPLPSSNPLEALLKQQHPALAHLGAPTPPHPPLDPHLGGPAWGAPGSAPPFAAPHMPPHDPLGLAASHALPLHHPLAHPPHAPPQHPHAQPQQGPQQGPLPNILPMLGLSGPPPAAASMPPPPFPPTPLSQSLAASAPPTSLPPFMAGAAPWGGLGPHPAMPPSPSQPLGAPPPHTSMLPPHAHAHAHAPPPMPAASAAPPQPPPVASAAPPAGSSPTERLLSLLRGAQQPQPQPPSSMPPRSVASAWEAQSPPAAPSAPEPPTNPLQKLIQQVEKARQEQRAHKEEEERKQWHVVQHQHQQQRHEEERKQQWQAQQEQQEQQAQQQQQQQQARHEEERRQQQWAEQQRAEQQQQQQQQRPVPTSKPAPWAEVSASLAPASKSLREIQEEEFQQQQALRQRQQQAAAAASPSPAPAPAPAASSPWVKAGSRAASAEPPHSPAAQPPHAAAHASPPLPGFPALNEAASQAASVAVRGAQQQQQQQQHAPPPPPSQPEGTGPGPRGTTLGDILGRTFDTGAPQKSAAWGGVGGKPPAGVPSVRQVMWRECAADMEGGAPEEDLSDVLPPYGNGGPAQPPHTHAADDGDDDMLWDYGGSNKAHAQPAQPAKPAPAQPASTPWSSIMATAKSAMASSSAPSAAQVAALGGGLPVQPRSGSAAAAAAKPAGGWASAVGGSGRAGAAPASAGARAPAAPAQGGGAAHSAQAAQAAAQQRAAQQAAAQQAAAQQAQQASASQGPPLMAGDVVLSSEFQAWCRNEMLRFFGHTDLSLVEVLVTLPSRSEVADYCSMFMEGKPGVSTFVAEFLKRKDAEVARATVPKKGSKSKSKAAPAPTTAASVVQGKAPAQPAAAAAPAPAPAAAPAGNGVRSSEWAQVPVAPPKAKSGAAGGQQQQQKGSKGGAAGGGAAKKAAGFNVLKTA